MNGKLWAVVPFLAVVACAGDSVVGPVPRQVAQDPSFTSSNTSRVAALRRDESDLASYLQRLQGRNREGSPSTRQQTSTDMSDVRHSLQVVRDRIAELENANPGDAAGRLVPGRASHVLQYYVDADGYPVYPEGTIGRWIDAGTWLKIELGTGFRARGQYSIPALLKTSIRGNSLQQWTRSSDDGITFAAKLPETVTHATLLVPLDKQDCTKAAVRLWGQAEHTASYKAAVTVGGLGLEGKFQADSRESRYPDQTCEHLPTSGELVGPDHISIGGTATLAAFFRWATPSAGCTDIAWSSNSSAATLSSLGEGSQDARVVTGQHEGTVSITATCNGFTIGRQMMVSDAPPAPCDDLLTDHVETCEENPPPGEKETKGEEYVQDSPFDDVQFEDMPIKTVCLVRDWWERTGTGPWRYINTEVLRCWKEWAF